MIDARRGGSQVRKAAELAHDRPADMGRTFELAEAANERFDELVALRSEVKRLRSLIAETATSLDTAGLAREATRLRKKAGPQASD